MVSIALSGTIAPLLYIHLKKHFESGYQSTAPTLSSFRAVLVKISGRHLLLCQSITDVFTIAQ